jgi:hypothetical protein
VKYALLIWDNGARSVYDDMPEAEQKSVFGEYLAINDLPGTTGGFQLQPSDTTTTVRVENGSTLTTDGPFVESKEVLGGLYVFEASDLDGAIEVAARIPAARLGGAVEVRPIVER